MSKVLLVYGVKNWSWHHMAEDLRKFAPADIVAVPVSTEEFQAVCRLSGPHGFGEVDAAFHFAWSNASLLKAVPAERYGALVTSAGILYPKVRDDDWNTWIVTKERNSSEAKLALCNLDCVIAVNRVLALAANAINAKATVRLPIGVNCELFSPVPKKPGDMIRVGWCGDRSGDRSVKGYNELLVPVASDLRLGRFAWVINDRTYLNALPRRQMVEWYRGLDVFLCTSINEGSPNTILEAAACGVPVVSTDVGMVSDWPEMRELSLVVPAYRDPGTLEETKRRMVETLLRMFSRPNRRNECSEALLESVRRRYSWEHLAPRWLKAMLGREAKDA